MTDTQKEIGPSFADDLAVHGGLIGQPFAWQADGTIFFPEGLEQSVIDGVNTVYAAHDPSTLSLSEKSAQQAALMAEANSATAGMADSYVAGLLDAADETTFKAWAAYKLALSRVDLTQRAPTWPAQPSAEEGS